MCGLLFIYLLRLFSDYAGPEDYDQAGGIKFLIAPVGVGVNQNGLKLVFREGKIIIFNEGGGGLPHVGKNMIVFK